MDNFLYTGGIVLSACALAGGIIYFLIYRLKALRLRKILNEEYGEKEKNKS